MTFTNVTEAPIEVPDDSPMASPVCRTRIILSVDETFRVQLDTGSADLDRALAWQASWAPFPHTPLPEPMTAAELDASTTDGGEGLVEPRASCEPAEVVLAPGESTSITESLVVGAVGLPPGGGASATPAPTGPSSPPSPRPAP